MPQLDYLVKHSRMKRCIVAKLGVTIGQWYVRKTTYARIHFYKVVDKITTTNFTSLIIWSLVDYGRLSVTNIANKLVYFGVDKITIFHNVKSGVMTQLMQKYIPFVSDVHCMAHRTNIVVQTLNTLSLVSKIEFLFVSMYNYFCHNLKLHLETTKLVELLQLKGNKILNNIKTHWISMLSLSKHVLSEYKPPIVKMVEDSSTINTTRTNYKLFCDVETF